MFGQADDHLAGVLAAQILGPLLFKRFVLGQTLDKDTVTQVVDAALAPWLPTP
ncbi:hypothetical protein ABZX85_15440 [Streptomyces sp. NPDC004539]|uniref:hypothetical protein n=1 Tax=Streptomyces sp. NPDC004539 TaxID=3154280 RepID=UPI0033A95372